MLPIACLLPHSPLLLDQPVNGIHRSPHPQTTLAIGKIATELERLQIDTLISISNHPRYARDGFSVNISSLFAVDFSDFGDLATRLEFKPAWNVFHALREQYLAEAATLHPLADQRLDYAHGLPLHLLAASWPKANQLKLLPINDHPATTAENREAFGRWLTRSLHARPEKCAVFVSGDLATQNATTTWQTIKENNTQSRYQLQSLAQADSKKTIDQTLCIGGPTQILRGIVEEAKLVLTAESFEHVSPTSFLTLTFQKI